MCYSCMLTDCTCTVFCEMLNSEIDRMKYILAVAPSMIRKDRKVLIVVVQQLCYNISIFLRFLGIKFLSELYENH